MLLLIISIIGLIIVSIICSVPKISKKIKIGLITVELVLLVYSSLAAVKPIYIHNASALSEEAFAGALAGGYFNYLRMDFITGVNDYKILDANIFESDETVYLDIAYDVKPTAAAYFDWNAGNGHAGEDGWLVGKYSIYSYRNTGNFYFVTCIGTGL